MIVDRALNHIDIQEGVCPYGLTCKLRSRVWNLSSIFEDLLFHLLEKEEDRNKERASCWKTVTFQGMLRRGPDQSNDGKHS